MAMRNPAHPGEIIREECLAPLGLTVTAAAEDIGVSRKALSTLLNGHAGVSPDMAVRLEKPVGAVPKHGCACSSPTIFGTPSNAQAP
jgi:antitoxin HigA-1